MEVPESERARDRPETAGGKTYVITGTLTSMSREQATAALERLGAKVAGSVSKKTTAVVRGGRGGQQGGQGQGLGVPLLDEADLLPDS
jgi:DNA ligase (NAD+)